MVKIHFSSYVPGQVLVPLARACGVGNPAGPDVLEEAVTVLVEQGRRLWSAAELGEADLAVYSHIYYASPETAAFAEAARRAGVPCLFFDLTDSDEAGPPPYGTVYRGSIQADRRQPWEQPLVPLCRDALPPGPGAQVNLRPKGPTPSVGFCGYIAPFWKRAGLLLRGGRLRTAGHVARGRALAALRKSRRIRTDFIRRERYWGGALLFKGDPTRVDRVRQVFVDNLLGNDYALCVRGAGNYSYRLYEALSAGRIPLLIDTNCALPFADRIDWGRHCVIVPEGEIDSAADRLADFHAALDEPTFREMQLANRRLWEEYLNPVAFLSRVIADALGGRVGRDTWGGNADGVSPAGAAAAGPSLAPPPQSPPSARPPRQGVR